LVITDIGLEEIGGIVKAVVNRQLTEIPSAMVAAEVAASPMAVVRGKIPDRPAPASTMLDASSIASNFCRRKYRNPYACLCYERHEAPHVLDFAPRRLHGGEGSRRARRRRA
jgi:hypothetical protein